jgi:hypothetical protein
MRHAVRCLFFSLVSSPAAAQTAVTSTIESNLPLQVGSLWGTWGSIALCPPPQTIVRFRQRVQPAQGLLGDDTALNDVQAQCSDGTSLQLKGGDKGDWSAWVSCPPGMVGAGMQLRVEANQGFADDSGADDFRLICKSPEGGLTSTLSAGNGLTFGEWDSGVLCPSGRFACGLQLNIESGTTADGTGLNNVRLTCCLHCFAVSAPSNGGLGTCDTTVASGSSCWFNCNVGYTISGLTSCSLGTLTAASCTPTLAPSRSPSAGPAFISTGEPVDSFCYYKPSTREQRSKLECSTLPQCFWSLAINLASGGGCTIAAPTPRCEHSIRHIGALDC